MFFESSIFPPTFHPAIQYFSKLSLNCFVFLNIRPSHQPPRSQVLRNGLFTSQNISSYIYIYIHFFSEQPVTLFIKPDTLNIKIVSICCYICLKMFIIKIYNVYLILRPLLKWTLLWCSNKITILPTKITLTCQETYSREFWQRLFSNHRSLSRQVKI